MIVKKLLKEKIDDDKLIKQLERDKAEIEKKYTFQLEKKRVVDEEKKKL